MPTCYKDAASLVESPEKSRSEERRYLEKALHPNPIWLVGSAVQCRLRCLEIAFQRYSPLSNDSSIIFGLIVVFPQDLAPWWDIPGKFKADDKQNKSFTDYFTDYLCTGSLSY